MSMCVAKIAKCMGVVAVLFMCACRCMLNRDLDQVALYIQNLHSAGYNTIFSLFNISRSTSPQKITEIYARLIRQCYMAKTKKQAMPIGTGMSELEAKKIIVNGYKILTQPKLRKVYDWILDEAHPQFMENYKKREGEGTAGKGIFHPLSLVSIFTLLFFSFVMLDVLRVCIPCYLGTKCKKAGKAAKKQKKAQSAKKVDIKDMYIYKGYQACRNLVKGTKK